MAILAQLLEVDASLTELLRVLTSTTEYEELPVRHNEDKLNFELAKECVHSVTDQAMDEPTTKYILLMQTHLSRLPLPITDYVTDLRSVLNQSILIIQIDHDRRHVVGRPPLAAHQAQAGAPHSDDWISGTKLSNLTA